MKKWLGVPNSWTNVALYSSSMKLKLLILSLFEEFKLGKARLSQMLCDSRPTSEEHPAFCNNQLEMEGENICRECRISP